MSDETEKPTEGVEVKTGELADDQLETVAGGLSNVQVTSLIQKKGFFRPNPTGDGTTEQ